jgi:membrane protein DedA with SNARE-associated domain
MLEEILTFISQLDTGWIYIVLFLFAFIENIFPPSPSDVVVIVGASLIASTSISFIPILLITSIGSALGFILMYYVGYYLGEKFLRTGKIKFIKPEELEKTDKWFAKWGYKLILANRFLPGTRSVISFFSGVHELNVFRTFLYASISAFLWNIVIIYLGMQLGNNVELIDYYLSTYSTIILVITLFILLALGIRFIIVNRRKGNNAAGS